MRDLKYIIAYIIPISGWMALEYKGAWAWATVILAFGIIPVLDFLLPTSTKNVQEDQEDSRSKVFFFDFLLFICAPICFIITFLYLRTIQNEVLSTLETIGLTLSTGVVLGATGINVAHELGHRPGRIEQFFAKAGLLMVLYQHFFIEHNRGHHKNVSTPADPATARKNEPVYLFLFRSIVGQYIDAWKLENNRLQKKGLKILNLENEMIRFSLYQSLYLLAVIVLFGIELLPFAFAIAFVGVVLLEIINYIEHYGLQREILPSGHPEKVMPKHSWNSDHEMGRIVLFELTRHSDHHYKASRKYQILRHMEESPQLPTGYPGCMLLALVPPLWFRVMNKRLEKKMEIN
jgi:alkane 1-monooxygenase